MATSSGLFLATIYNQSQLAERKHVARHWLINTAATAVPLSGPLSVSYYNEISGGHIGRGEGCSEEVFCRPSTALWFEVSVWAHCVLWSRYTNMHVPFDLRDDNQCEKKECKRKAFG